jgi:hypothetical protein
MAHGQGFEIGKLVLGALLDCRDPEVEGGLREEDDGPDLGGVNRSSTASDQTRDASHASRPLRDRGRCPRDASPGAR